MSRKVLFFIPLSLLFCVSTLSSVFAQSSTAPASIENRSTPKPNSQPAPAPTPFRIDDVEISGSVRARFESWDWFDTDAADGNYNFGAATFRLALGQNKEKFEWLVEVSAPVFVNLPENAIAPGA